MPLPERLAVELLEELDGYAHLRNKLREIAEARDDWAGIPCPVNGQRMVIEPKYPGAAGLMAISDDARAGDFERAQAEESADGYKPRGRFWSWHKRAWVQIWDTPSGKVDWGLIRGEHPVERLIGIAMCSAAWGIEQESNAVKLLGTLVRHHTFKDYLLTGMFLEQSKRSGVFYIFRRLRPTIALRPKGTTGMRALCTLCMHPIGYYRDTFAGVMTPTDEVVAHLMLMRGDEAMYWRRANQHPTWVPESGLF